MKIFIVAVHLVLGIIFIIGGLALVFGSYSAYVGYGVVGVALGLLSGAAGFDLVRNSHRGIISFQIQDINLLASTY